MTAYRLLAPAAATLVSLVLAMASFTAHADALQEATKSLKQGQHSQALEQVERYLATKPKDAQGRFLKGIILTEMNRNGEAITVFNRLTEDYPELPEPYNNLAVIYAQQKQYDKAKQALEMAIRTHPSYATAHENLGDLYARLASQAYDKALQLDSSNAAAQNKLALIRDLIRPDNNKVAMRPSKVEPAASAIKPITPLPPAATPPVAVAAAPAAKAPESAKPEPKTEARPETKPEPKPEARPEPKPEAAKPADIQADVARTLEAWAAAWSRKDVKAYLARYARDFKTPNGESRAEWETERNNRINKPGKISVSIENIKVTADNSEQVTARFRQHYKSASLSSSGNKTVVLVKREGKWLIQQERIGS